MIRRLLAAGVAVLLAGGLSACRGPEAAPSKAARDLSDAGLQRLAAGMDPATRALALRHDPQGGADPWGRPEGWTRLSLDQTPSLGFPVATDAAAMAINAARAVSIEPVAPMRPFRFRGGADDRARALQCLTQAVYYEAAREPLDGQQAVAQTVLNRVRHPDYPKSVCGVVFQGSARATGCQFSFTCDGSLRWAPEPALWSRARRVAEAALAGYVDAAVGSATHYHADYVAPYWAPTLVKLNQVGRHIFYRWTGPAGEPPAFTGRYAGGEARLTAAILQGYDPRTQSPPALAAAPRKVVLTVDGEARSYAVADAGQTTEGALKPTRRQPSAAEIKRINAALAEMEKRIDAPPAPQPAAATD